MTSEKVEVAPSRSTELQMTITFDVEDFTCPITQQIFFEPAQANNCEHYFEKEALDEWLATKKQCPCCKEKTQRSVRPSLIFRKVFQQTLHENPQLQLNRHFSLTSFIDHLENPTKDSELMKTMIDFLKQTRTHSEALELQVSLVPRATVIYWLARTPLGRTFLLDDEELRNQITVEELNTYIELQDDEDTQVSALLWLAGTIDGRKLLLSDDFLRSNITQEGLNKIVKKGPHRGESVLYWLTSSSSGIEVLAKDPELRQKITSEGLNAPLNNQERTGSSSLFELCCGTAGFDLLQKDAVLRSKITSAGLNAHVKKGPKPDCNPLFQLTLTTENRQLLIDDLELRSKITSEGLNMSITYQKIKGWSPLFQLTLLSNTRQLFIDDSVLRNKITSNGLNRVITTGYYNGECALLRLIGAGTDDGSRLLLEDRTLRKKITAVGLNTIIQGGKAVGGSPLYWLLTTSTGRQILRQDTNLVNKIMAEGLNSCTIEGRSALYWLAKNPDMHFLLTKQLKMLINKETLTRMVSIEGEKESSAASYLMKDPKGKALVLAILNETKHSMHHFFKIKENNENKETCTTDCIKLR
ncbi:MAG: hypothetical protein H2069_02445 [Legionella sp.]|nr:hypothetical protein [Legionella sp.]